jgi:hypothetical protein
MSQYLIRHIEARYERIDGQSWNAKDLPEDKQKWVHSYFINRSLKRTGQLYKSMMEQIHGKKK